MKLHSLLQHVFESVNETDYSNYYRTHNRLHVNLNFLMRDYKLPYGFVGLMLVPYIKMDGRDMVQHAIGLDSESGKTFYNILKKLTGNLGIGSTGLISTYYNQLAEGKDEEAEDTQWKISDVLDELTEFLYNQSDEFVDRFYGSMSKRVTAIMNVIENFGKQIGNHEHKLALMKVASEGDATMYYDDSDIDNTTFRKLINKNFKLDDNSPLKQKENEDANEVIERNQIGSMLILVDHKNPQHNLIITDSSEHSDLHIYNYQGLLTHDDSELAGNSHFVRLLRKYPHAELVKKMVSTHMNQQTGSDTQFAFLTDAQLESAGKDFIDLFNTAAEFVAAKWDGIEHDGDEDDYDDDQLDEMSALESLNSLLRHKWAEKTFSDADSIKRAFLKYTQIVSKHERGSDAYHELMNLFMDFSRVSNYIEDYFCDSEVAHDLMTYIGKHTSVETNGNIKFVNNISQPD